MKKLILAALALALPLAAAAQNKVIEKYGDRPIYGLIVSGAFEVQLSQEATSRPVGASVEIDSEVESKLIFDYTDDGYVRLSYKDDMSKYFTRNRKKPVVKITVTELRYMQVTGASMLTFTSVCSAQEEMRLLASGNANVLLLEVSAGSIAADISGNASLDDAKLRTPGELKIEQSGNSKLRGHADCGTLLLTQSGTSGLTLTGGAEEAVLTVSGTSSSHLESFNIGTVQAKVSGLAKIRAKVLNGGTAEVGTTASFRYSGEGLVTGKGVKRLD